MIGCRKLPSISWTATTRASVASPSSQPPSAKATSAATSPETKRADEGDECAHENEDCQRERERDSQDPEPEPDQRGIDGGDERRSTDEAAEDVPCPPPCQVDRRACRGREQRQDPRPQPRAVAQHEVEDRDREHQPSDQADARLDARSRIARRLLPRIAQ